MDDLFSRRKGKPLTEYDIPKIKHMIIKNYGFDFWNNCTIKELLELLPLSFEEYSKSENLRLSTLKHYGVRNPK